MHKQTFALLTVFISFTAMFTNPVKSVNDSRRKMKGQGWIFTARVVFVAELFQGVEQGLNQNLRHNFIGMVSF